MTYARRVAAAVMVVPLMLTAAPAGAVRDAASRGTPTLAARTPQVDVALTYKRVGKKVKVRVALTGFVYAPLDGEGVPIPFESPASIDIGMGQAWKWGDKSVEEGTDGGDVHCGGARRLQRLEDEFVLTKKYKKAGTYVFKYSFFACGLKGGKVKATLPIRIP